jgi:hypothetical protein
VKLTEATTWTDARVIGFFAGSVSTALLAALLLGDSSAVENVVVAVVFGSVVAILFARLLEPWPDFPGGKFLALLLPIAAAETLLWVVLRFVN